MRWTLVLITLVFCIAHGKKKKTERIIAGREAEIEEFPHQVSLETFYQHACGGAIISRMVVLTAAHCVQAAAENNVSPSKVLRVRVGSNVIQRGGEVIPVKYAVPHELYNDAADTDTCDVALLYLTRPITLNSKAQIVPLARNSPKVGSQASVSGYGSQLIEGARQRRSFLDHWHFSLSSRKLKVKNPGHLMAVELPIVSLKKCKRIIGNMGVSVADDMICAGYERGHKDACRGDSGGPAVVDGVLVAVTSWGLGCGLEGIPGVYTNLALYKDWILKRMEDLGERVTWA